MSIFNGAAADIENNKNKVDEITETSTNEQYPGAKATYDLVKQQVNGAIKPIELTGTELDVTASPQLENGFYKAAQNMKLVRAQGETENYYIPKDAVFAVYKSYDSEIGGDYTYYEVQLLNGCLLGEVGETISPFSTGNSYFYARVSLMGNIEYTVVSKMATDYNLTAAMQRIQSQIGLKTAALPEQSSAPSAGSKAYLITACDQTAKAFTLDGVYGLAVGDVYSISAVGYANVEDVGKITAINGKVVTVDHLPVENGVGYGNAVPSSDALPENFPQGLAAPYFRIIAKPTVGSQTIGTAALAGGISTEAQMDATFTTGKGCKSVGKYGIGMGNKNMAYYAAIAGGGGSNKAFGKNSGIIAGAGNKTNSYAAFVGGGQNNEIDGACAFGTGSFNKVPGFNAAAFGLYNESHGQNDFVTGYRNYSGPDSYCDGLFGTSNTNKGIRNFITGNGNNAKEGTNNCILTGQNNTLENASGCIAEGNENKIIGDNADKPILAGVAIGGYNKIISHYGAALGYNNTVGTQSFAAGASNNAPGWLRFALGDGLQVSGDRQVVVGTYNKPQLGVAFMVGNGTSGTDRSNAFVVYKDGSAEVAAQGTKDNSVVTLGTLEGKIAGIGSEFKEYTATTIDILADDLPAGLYVAKNSITLLNTPTDYMNNIYSIQQGARFVVLSDYVYRSIRSLDTAFWPDTSYYRFYDTLCAEKRAGEWSVTNFTSANDLTVKISAIKTFAQSLTEAEDLNAVKTAAATLLTAL